MPLALRLNGQLLLGLVRIHRRQVDYLQGDAADVLQRVVMGAAAAGGTGKRPAADNGDENSGGRDDDGTSNECAPGTPTAKRLRPGQQRGGGGGAGAGPDAASLHEPVTRADSLLLGHGVDLEDGLLADGMPLDSTPWGSQQCTPPLLGLSRTGAPAPAAAQPMVPPSGASRGGAAAAAALEAFGDWDDWDASGLDGSSGMMGGASVASLYDLSEWEAAALRTTTSGVTATALGRSSAADVAAAAVVADAAGDAGAPLGMEEGLACPSSPVDGGGTPHAAQLLSTASQDVSAAAAAAAGRSGWGAATGGAARELAVAADGPLGSGDSGEQQSCGPGLGSAGGEQHSCGGGGGGRAEEAVSAVSAEENRSGGCLPELSPRTPQQDEAGGAGGMAAHCGTLQTQPAGVQPSHLHRRHGVLLPFDELNCEGGVARVAASQAACGSPLVRLLGRPGRMAVDSSEQTNTVRRSEVQCGLPPSVPQPHRPQRDQPQA